MHDRDLLRFQYSSNKQKNIKILGYFDIENISSLTTNNEFYLFALSLYSINSLPLEQLSDRPICMIWAGILIYD
jgi:hypothetical protein